MLFDLDVYLIWYLHGTYIYIYIIYIYIYILVCATSMCMGLIYMVFVWALYRNYVRFVWIVYRICSRRDLYVICMKFILHFAFDCWTIPFWIPDVGYLTKRNTHKTAELQQYLVITSANTIIVCQKKCFSHNYFGTWSSSSIRPGH